MEIREIDGRKYIEYNQHKQNNKKLIIQVVFIICILVASFAMVKATKTLIENKDLIVQDPLIYGLELHNFSSCQCFNDFGQTFTIGNKLFLEAS